MPRKSAAELKKQRRADRWGLGSADTPPVDGAPTPAELTNQWVEAHYNDKAPDGVAWGDHVKKWRSDGAKDTHISAIIAATTYTKDATISSITLTDLLEDYDPPAFGVEFTHPAHVQDNNGLTPLLFVLTIVYGWLHSHKAARTALLLPLKPPPAIEHPPPGPVPSPAELCTSMLPLISPRPVVLPLPSTTSTGRFLSSLTIMFLYSTPPCA